MPFLPAALAVVVVLLIVLRERDLRQLERILIDGAKEHISLLDAQRVELRHVLGLWEADRLQTHEANRRLFADFATERQTLLERIQHPERAQVAVVPREPVESPKDSAEIAHVGQIVPEGIQVGTHTNGD